MAGLGNTSRSIIQICILLLFLIAVQATREENCYEPRPTCPGPVEYYKTLRCTPIYANPNDTCAKAYDCSHLDNLSPDKCYANGHEYSIGETLRPEDSNPCDKNCTCVMEKNFVIDGHPNLSHFRCVENDSCYYLDTTSDTCLYKRTHGICCRYLSCTIGNAKAICNDDGELYFAGQYFRPKSNPKLYCLCLDGYTGENVEPYCREMKRDPCDLMFNQNIAEVYSRDILVLQSTSRPNPCPIYDFIYVQPEDYIIYIRDNDTSISEGEHYTCQHGNQTFHIGDELYLIYRNVKCVCEVPPIMSCKEFRTYVTDI